MPRVIFNKDKTHYVGIPESIWKQVQAKAFEDRLYVTQYVHKLLLSSLKSNITSTQHEGTSHGTDNDF